jgi:hypothetical protein
MSVAIVVDFLESDPPRGSRGAGMWRDGGCG